MKSASLPTATHWDSSAYAAVSRVAASIPLQRMASPQDIANACLYLASPLASYVSGVDVCVHGGGESPAFLAAANVD